MPLPVRPTTGHVGSMRSLLIDDRPGQTAAPQGEGITEGGGADAKKPPGVRELAELADVNPGHASRVMALLCSTGRR
jgi:hypothetical protein